MVRKARRLAVDRAFRREWRELRRLRHLTPYAEGESSLPGFAARFSHPHAFVAQYRQMFQDGVYAARLGPAPVILDVGANYGLAAIVLKRDHPDARIVAFEADPAIADIAAENLRAAGVTDVTLVRAAAWTRAGTMRFSSEGSDGGRLGGEGGIDVPTVRLRDYLDRDVDLLKMDIEGAEVDVLLDCADRLHRVRNVVCEYHSYAGRSQRLGELLSVLEGACLRVMVQHDMAPAHPLVSVPTDASGMDMRLNLWAYRPA